MNIDKCLEDFSPAGDVLLANASNVEQKIQVALDRVGEKKRIARYHELFEFGPWSGKLFNKVNRCSTARATEEAGCCNNHGYRNVKIDGKIFKAHRIIYEMHHGAIPAGLQIDHIDGDRSNNRLDNLRLVTPQGNSKNQRRSRNNTSGVTGVYFDVKSKKWRARIQVDGKSKNIGFFKKKEDAIAARKCAEVKFGYHENHGKVLEVAK